MSESGKAEDGEDKLMIKTYGAVSPRCKLLRSVVQGPLHQMS